MMSTVRVVTTGGTIAMANDDSAGGAVPALGSTDFLRLLAAGTGPVEIEEFCNLPSAHFGLDTIWGLRTRVDELARMEGVQGVVITH
ncbi:MAG: asparaginase domain-containing protein, partial [Anaerolineae bacterium]|nr:asparaginase domain-containing protein [Anaerolineae bacterium]